MTYTFECGICRLKPRLTKWTATDETNMRWVRQDMGGTKVAEVYVSIGRDDPTYRAVKSWVYGRVIDEHYTISAGMLWVDCYLIGDYDLPDPVTALGA